MPAKSKAQQKAAGAALAVKRGETKTSKLKGASRGMARSMSERQLKEIAGTKRKSLPARKAAKSAPSRKRVAAASKRKTATRKRSGSR